MPLPKKAQQLLHFKHKDTWYLIARLEDEKYGLYREGASPDDSGKTAELLSTSKSPIKLEQSVYNGGIS